MMMRRSDAFGAWYGLMSDYASNHAVLIVLDPDKKSYEGSCRRISDYSYDTFTCSDELCICECESPEHLIIVGAKGLMSTHGFGFVRERDFCDGVMTFLHESRHVFRDEQVDEGKTLAMSLESGIIISEYDYSYYQKNHCLMANEFDAESYAITGAQKFLSKFWKDESRANRVVAASLSHLKSMEARGDFHPAISLAEYMVGDSFDTEAYSVYVRGQYEKVASISRDVEPLRVLDSNQFVPERLNLFTGTCMRYGLHSVEFDETEPGVSQDIYVASAICATSDEATCAHPNFEGVPVTVSERARERHAELVADYERKRGDRSQSGTLDDVDRDAIGRAAMLDAAGMRAVSDDFARDFGP